MNATERAEYMAIVAALAAGSGTSGLPQIKIAEDAMYLWIAANKLAKGLEK